jgi:hypothetical protein
MANSLRPIDALNRLRQLGLAFAVSQSFFAGSKLGIFDALSEEPATAEELGSKLDVHPEGLKRLLVVLHRLELLDRDGERFRTSELGSYARTDSRFCMDGLSKIETFVRMWEFLPESVRNHGPVWQEAFGSSSQAVFTELYANPEELRRFCDYMDSYSMAIGHEIADAYDFSVHRRLMDVAGGPGGLSRLILKKHPHLHGVVMDLPEVLAVTRERIEADGLSDRLETETADLFEGAYPKGADVLTLSWILHDWNDEKCARILGHCFEALPSGGVLLISESVMNEDYSGSSLWSEIYSLFMLVVCESEGRERPESEHRALLEQAGFRDVELRRSEGPRDLIVARKP